MDDIYKIQRFQQTMIDFWYSHGRHELPWRQTSNAWRILLAEVLLRKTTSSQVQDVYEKIADITPEQLAAQETETIAILLKPLGMYQVRAEQLKRIAESIVDAGIEALESDEFLQSLPGVGRYISNSVRCCAFGIPLPALDTNLIRLMDRILSWKSSRKRPREDKSLWQQAEKLVPKEKAREFNWGMLDFASAVCTFSSPKCNTCSIQDICEYYHNLQVAEQQEKQ